jgi:RND family efflux transporter MFP subunit
MSRRTLTSLVIALAALLMLYGIAGGAGEAPSQSANPRGEAPTSVKVLTAFTAEEVPTFPGRAEAGDSAMLAFRVAGQLRELKVRMGESVTRGAVLAELDPTDYRLNLDARQAEFDLAKLEADRASALYKKKLISEDQYDTAQTLLATNEARLEQAREQLSFCKLTAPFSGAIAFTYAMPSEIVGPQQPILNLQDTSTLDIQFNLPLRFQHLLEGEDKAVFTVMFELMPGIDLETQYKELSMQPDPDTNSYPVTLLVNSPADFSARPGMPASVRLHHPSLSDARWAPPAEALFDRSGMAAHVWRIDTSNMTIQKVAVELDAGGVLLAGLSPGDQIVAAGVDRLSEGQRVRPWLREGGL